MKYTRTFKVEDLDCEILVNVANSAKEVFSWADEYIENLKYDWFDASDDSFEILYDDGTEDYINSDYDGHKIRRQHIASMVYNNSADSIVYGNFEMNEYGMVHTAYEEKIDNTNIREIA